MQKLLWIIAAITMLLSGNACAQQFTLVSDDLQGQLT
jgi:hypothetical protein